MIRGTDISHFEAGLNIATLPKDISFVSIKASQGATEQDPNFQGFYHDLKNKRPDIVRIPYHFLDWQADGSVQAMNFLSRGVNFKEPGTGPMMLDLEADSDSITEKYIMANRLLCIQRVNDFKAALFASPLYSRPDLIIYSNDDFIKNTIRYSWPDTIFWVASYQPHPPPFLPGWPFKFWQYSEFGQLNGAVTGGNLDLDQFTGAQTELNTLANIPNENS